MSYQDFTAWKSQPASSNPLLSIVIPTYNESERIVPTLAAVAAYVSSRGYDFEIIVSDDGSSDGTPDLVRRLGLRNVRVLDPVRNRGKGAAVRDGVLAAVGQYILFTDADLSTPIEHLDALLDEARAGVPVVIGTRSGDESTECNRSLLRKSLSALLRLLVRFCLGRGFTDTQCGFKLFERAAARRLFGELSVDGFSFDLELLWLANRHGLEVAEVPVTWYDAPGSTVQPFRTSCEFVRSLATLELRRFTARRPSGGQVREPAGALDLAVVTAMPPSKTTLNEYGFHLTRHLRSHPDVSSITALTEFGEVEAPAGVGAVPCWQFNSALNPIRILRAVRAHRPDAVIFNLHFTAFGTKRIAAASGLLTPMLLRLAGVPTVVLLHNLSETVDLEEAGYGVNRWVNALMLWAASMLTRVILCADKVGTTMPAYVDILEQKYAASNVFLSPHGVFDTSAFEGCAPSDGVRRVVAFGKFGTYKRLEGLVEAHRSLHEDPAFSDVELVIAGTDSPSAAGYIASVRSSCTDVPSIHFTGYVEERDVPDLFKSASVVAFPYTSTTGSSGPLHQAGTYGRAVVVPEVGDFIELISEEGFVGRSFDPEDSQALARALRDVLGSEELRDELGTANHIAANVLPLGDIVDWHIQHIEELVNT